MINKHTVLILGAGARRAFGLPLGTDLRAHILGGIPSSPGQQPGKLTEILQALGFDGTLIAGFRREFDGSNLDSIDDFLRTKREYREVARASIAWCISNHEDVQRLNDLGNPDRWHHFLWQRLSQSARPFNNKLCIVTYNYDRALEEFLFRSYQSCAPSTESDQDIANAVMQLPIIHLHGSIGPLPWQNANTNIPFGHKPIGLTEYKQMADNIRTIYDSPSDDDQSMQRAIDYLRNANAIAFLGFGYHETHLTLLDIPDNAKGASIVGTAVKLGQGKTNQVRQLVGDHAQLLDVECLKLLEDTSLLY